ncbi:MAG: SRPBCC family protein [Actinomycetota bacterium]|nr:SRPBCC family protein [Actinomycetota bacterium]
MTTSTDTLARGLGLASLALGVPQVAAPDRFAEAVGTRPDAGTRDLTVGIGLRELTAAAGLLVRGSSPTFLWSRVAGDVMDLVLLGGALRRGGPGRGRTVAATAAVAGLTALDLAAARRSRRSGASASGDLELTAAVTVAKSPQEVYDFWRGLERLPAFMEHLHSVEWTGEGRTRWSAKGPLGKAVSWDAELTEDVRGEVIAWRSLPGADVDNSGSVRFTPAPAGRGTEVRVHLRYAVPGGRLGATVARLLGEEPHQQVEDDLRRFKQVLETGEVVRSDGTPEGPAARRHLLQSPGQPA